MPRSEGFRLIASKVLAHASRSHGEPAGNTSFEEGVWIPGTHQTISDQFPPPSPRICPTRSPHANTGPVGGQPRTSPDPQSRFDIGLGATVCLRGGREDSAYGHGLETVGAKSVLARCKWDEERMGLLREIHKYDKTMTVGGPLRTTMGASHLNERAIGITLRTCGSAWG